MVLDSSPVINCPTMSLMPHGCRSRKRFRCTEDDQENETWALPLHNAKRRATEEAVSSHLANLRLSPADQRVTLDTRPLNTIEEDQTDVSSTIPCDETMIGIEEIFSPELTKEALDNMHQSAQPNANSMQIALYRIPSVAHFIHNMDSVELARFLEKSNDIPLSSFKSILLQHLAQRYSRQQRLIGPPGPQSQSQDDDANDVSLGTASIEELPDEWEPDGTAPMLSNESPIITLPRSPSPDRCIDDDNMVVDDPMDLD